ncbi:ABC transporter permease [Labrys miyagiensis]|uniref:ABC transporter permease n=2 Tax=Labrys miyagiensis TaxID=346912 RepID=A0ABQ6CJJ0_9HYPH|nr:ABC transporter permease [Labrys miyagiensis]
MSALDTPSQKFHRLLIQAFSANASSLTPLPWWADTIMLPLINLLIAFMVSGIVVWAFVGADPLTVGTTMIQGAFGDANGIGTTLYYATTYIFAGLAVAVAFHAGLFNIGVDGQGQVAGLGIAFACLHATALPWFLTIPIGIVAAMIFGALWSFLPGYLQAKRGSHIVITTIMFNYIATDLVQYLIVHVLMKPGTGDPKSELFPDNASLPTLSDMLAYFGVNLDLTLVNLAFPLSLLAAFLVWLLIWRSRFGYAMRTVGHNKTAAVYAGISPARIIIVTMLVSGALAGLMGTNVLMGDQHRMFIDYTAGAGFIGIAVSLMGRSHPVGIVLASILFGALIQGGQELVFDYPVFDRHLIEVIQGMIILFVGALELMVRPQLVAVLGPFLHRKPKGA